MIAAARCGTRIGRTAIIGSFPIYAIGNMMAALRHKEPSFAGAMETSDYAKLADALTASVWRHGWRFTRDELLTAETERPLDAGAYLKYLAERYG